MPFAMLSGRLERAPALAWRDFGGELPPGPLGLRRAPAVVAPVARFLDVRGLTIRARDGRSLVRDVSFSLAAGHTLGIVGESGSGKSLTCRALLRLLPPGLSMSAASLVLDGRDLTALTPAECRQLRRERFGAVFQDPGSYLNPSMRIGSQLAESVLVHKRCRGREAAERSLALLEAVGMREPAQVARQFPFELSGGMQQRVMIAIALSGDPDLLIADEVTTALDVIVQKQVIALLQKHQAERGLSMIVVSHDLALVSEVCDDLVVMQDGVVVERGSRAEVLRDPQHPYTRSLIANHLKYGLEAYD
jgi:peptide/nickel transport system ATP-binding protein